MRNAILAVLGIASLFPLGKFLNSTEEQTITDVYRFKMNVHTPRIYNNMESLGSRRYVTDKIEGELLLTYDIEGKSAPEITVTNLVNKSYKIGGRYVQYKTYLNEAIFPRVNLVGNNKTGKFRVPSVCFALVCDPSYNIGEVDEDNTLYITLGGSGNTGTRRGTQVMTTLSGYLAGTLGCGCTAYGHISPTRVNGAYGPILDKVDDVAAVWGTWRATYKCSL